MNFRKVFADESVVNNFLDLTNKHSWAFQEEARIFESFDKIHIVMRIPVIGTIVVREDSPQLNNTHMFLSQVKDTCGIDAYREITTLVSSKDEFLRGIKKSGAIIFKPITEFPKHFADEDFLQLNEILPQSLNLFPDIAVGA